MTFVITVHERAYRFATLSEATTAANDYAERTGNIVGIVDTNTETAARTHTTHAAIAPVAAAQVTSPTSEARSAYALVSARSAVGYSHTGFECGAL